MIKRVIILSLIFVLAVFQDCFSADTYSGGTGEPNNPYRIASANDLMDIGGHVEDFNKCFVLVNDINLDDYVGYPYPIGHYLGGYEEPFTGVFDGNGFDISNFTYHEGDFDYLGLFGYVNDSNAEIRDVTLIDPNIDNILYGGALLVGYLKEGTVTGCGVEGGSISGDGQGYVGGLIGRNDNGTVSNSYSTAGVLASTDLDIGGLVGSNGGTINACYSTGSVSGNFYVGGLVGRNNNGMISNSYAAGNISGEVDVGGLVGSHLGGTISNSYAFGDVNGINGYAGGLIGENSSGMVSNSYAANHVTGTLEWLGGLVGFNSSGIYTKNFWDSDVNPDVNGFGFGPDDPNVIAKSTIQMQTKSTFTDAAWDFLGENANGTEDTWRLCIDGTNYPKLWWEFTMSDFICPDGVNFLDFAVLADIWSLSFGQTGFNDNCDLIDNDVIDFADMAIFASHWLEDN